MRQVLGFAKGFMADKTETVYSNRQEKLVQWLFIVAVTPGIAVQSVAARRRVIRKGDRRTGLQGVL